MSGIEIVRSWFRSQGWVPYPFQEEAWQKDTEGKSGLIHVPTGAGKTYAAFMGALSRFLEAPSARTNPGLRILYLTPLKAVSRDIALALQRPVTDLGLGFRVEMRTGDTKASLRAKQKKSLPEVLVTTPESFSLLLTYQESAKLFEQVECVIVDEWHELLETKRGSLLELDLARLREISPRIRTWALSATLSNLDEAAQAAVGQNRPFEVIRAQLDRPVLIDTLIPDVIDSFPWAGHLGLKMLPKLLRWLEPEKSTLIFTNTRSQAERWYQALRAEMPECEGRLALHHGSLDRAARETVESGVKSGEIAFVVCTSSLDLGVDFGPVERVVQIGSPKGIGRLVQRAGRAAHRPGAACSLLFVPTNALELVEISAAREAIERGEIEPRRPLSKPLDVLAQHLVSRALGGGFTFDKALAEARSSVAFHDLSPGELRWAIDLTTHGGASLRGYPAYHKVVENNGRYIVENSRTARLHRMNIGTIVSDASVELRFEKGQRLGQIEEAFVTKLQRGDRFLYAGRVLEFVRMKDLKAQVKLARKGTETVVTTWHGGRLPFSASLSSALRRALQEAADSKTPKASEMEAIEPILQMQRRLSDIPRDGQLLAEIARTREGRHLFIYPFEGRPIHEGMAAVLALRMSERHRSTFSLSVNDYGIEFLCPDEFPYEEVLDHELFSSDDLLADINRGMNVASLAKMQFREIARVAGLIFQTYPGAPKTMRQVQVSASLLFDVFNRYDSGNLLLRQAERQVFERQMDSVRLRATFRRIQAGHLNIRNVPRPTPLGFPLLAERLSARVSSESLAERIARMKDQWSRI